MLFKATGICKKWNDLVKEDPNIQRKTCQRCDDTPTRYFPEI